MEVIKRIPAEAINAAAEWWAKRISKTVIHDNGDNSFGSVYAGMLADMSAVELSAEQIQRFKNSLVMLLSRKASMGFGRDRITLDCDYSPCELLSQAGKDVDIPRANFPWKVTMCIVPEKVVVSDGYGRPFETIWSVENSKKVEEAVMA